MYETKVIESADHFHCEISYRRGVSRSQRTTKLSYRGISNFFQFVQAVVLVATVI